MIITKAKAKRVTIAKVRETPVAALYTSDSVFPSVLYNNIKHNTN
jgi:hypothetical protein